MLVKVLIKFWNSLMILGPKFGGKFKSVFKSKRKSTSWKVFNKSYYEDDDSKIWNF